MAKHIGDDGGVVPPELGELLGNKGSNAYVLETDSVDHAAGRFAHPRGGCPGHGLERQPLDHDSTQPVQIHQVGELDAVTKGATGRNNGIFEAKGPYVNSEVNRRGPFGDAYRLGRTHFPESNTTVKPCPWRGLGLRKAESPANRPLHTRRGLC